MHENVTDHIYPTNRLLVDHYTSLPRVLQHFQDFLPDRTEPGNHNRPLASDAKLGMLEARNIVRPPNDDQDAACFKPL